MRVRNISKIILYHVKIDRKHIGKTIVVHNLKERCYRDVTPIVVCLLLYIIVFFLGTNTPQEGRHYNIIVYSHRTITIDCVS